MRGFASTLLLVGSLTVHVLDGAVDGSCPGCLSSNGLELLQVRSRAGKTADVRGLEAEGADDDDEDLKVYLRNVRDLENMSWRLPFPLRAEDFGMKHGCLPQKDIADRVNFAASRGAQRETTRSAFYYAAQLDLREAVRQASKNFTVPVLAVSFEPQKGPEKVQWLLREFACHMRRIDVQALVFVLSAEDRALVAAHPPLLAIDMSDIAEGFMANASPSANAERLSIYTLKWPGAAAVLNEGAPGVFVTDIDVLWLQDPRPHLLAMQGVDVAVSLDAQCEHLWEDTDDWAQVEKVAAKEHVSACCRGGFPYNAGQVFFGGPSSLQLLRTIIVLHLDFMAKNRATQAHPGTCTEDQNPMHWALFDHCRGDRAKSKCRILEPRLFRDANAVHLPTRLGGLEPISMHLDDNHKERRLLRAMHKVEDVCAEQLNG